MTVSFATPSPQRTRIMTRIVIKVDLKGKKSRSKAMTVAGGLAGVESVNFAGQDEMVVIGEGIDAVKLTKLLRKKVGSSQLVSMNPVDHYGNDSYSYGTMHVPLGGQYYSLPYAHESGQAHGYVTTGHNPYQYGQGYALDQKYGQGYAYHETSQHNPNTCSIM